MVTMEAVVLVVMVGYIPLRVGTTVPERYLRHRLMSLIRRHWPNHSTTPAILLQSHNAPHVLYQKHGNQGSRAEDAMYE
jgi:hypothetical protein